MIDFDSVDFGDLHLYINKAQYAQSYLIVNYQQDEIHNNNIAVNLLSEIQYNNNDMFIPYNGSLSFNISGVNSELFRILLSNIFCIFCIVSLSPSPLCTLEEVD